MNTIGLTILVRMGNCICARETVEINGSKYYIRDHIGEGFKTFTNSTGGRKPPKRAGIVMTILKEKLDVVNELRGFSTVVLVESAANHKLYALKRITCHAQSDEKAALCEVEYHKALCHPNIVECIDSDLVGVPDLVGNKTSQVLILLPYFQRGTLHDELMRRQETNSSLEETTVLTTFRGICEATLCMHSAKPHPLAHRDIKTANVLLKDDFTPVVMDLGSMARARIEVNGSSDARKLQDEAAEKSSMAYRAPELFNVEAFCHIDERTDVWSLGCLLYALCFYKSPFEAVYERGDSVALAVVSGNIRIPDNHSYSKDVIELIESLLKVNSEERPYVDWIVNSVDQLINKSAGAV